MMRLNSALLLVLFSIACHQNAGLEKDSLAVDAFEKILLSTTDCQLLDVRTPGEFASGHLANAINMDYNGDDFNREINQLEKSKPVFIYCLSGGRSASAAKEMREMGFASVTEMKGGITAWLAAGKSIVKQDGLPLSEGMLLEDYDKLINQDNLVLVDFGATWCDPCKKLAPVLDEIVLENNELRLVKIDADENKNLLSTMQISVLPTLLLYRKGHLVWKGTGVINKQELLAKIK